MTTSTSAKDFAGTVNALKTAVSDNGMMILGELDQASALKAAGLNIAGAHTFFVGNPSVGKMFFEQTPAIGSVRIPDLRGGRLHHRTDPRRERPQEYKGVCALL